MNLVLSIFVSDILPVFAIAGAGFLLARLAKCDVQTLVRIVFYALLPCLAFRMVVTSTATGPDAFRMIWFAGVIMGTMGLIGYIATKACRLNSPETRAFLMVVMFSNGGNYGLPVVRFAFGEETMRYATFFFLSGSVLTYVASAFFAGEGSNRFAGALSKVWRMPSLYGVVLALLVLATGQPVPDVIMRPVSLLSDSALPLMILVLGMQLERAAMPARPKLVALAVAISVLVAPLVALGLTAAFGITGPARQAAVTLSSMPVAVITTILALEFNLSPDFATAAVFLSTIISPLTLTPLIAYLQ